MFPWPVSENPAAVGGEKAAVRAALASSFSLKAGVKLPSPPRLLDVGLLVTRLMRLAGEGTGGMERLERVNIKGSSSLGSLEIHTRTRTNPWVSEPLETTVTWLNSFMEIEFTRPTIHPF